MIVLALVFAVLFGLSLVWPVTQLIQVPAFYAEYGYADATPWVLLVVMVLLPVVLYVVGLLLGRGRPPFEAALILTASLATSFVLFFGLVTLSSALSPIFF